MHWLIYVSWLVGPVLQITLLSLMIQRKLHVVFPRFFSYILFQIVKSGILFVIYQYYDGSYFDAYWTGNAISVLLAVTVREPRSATVQDKALTAALAAEPGVLTVRPAALSAAGFVNIKQCRATAETFHPQLIDESVLKKEWGGPADAPYTLIMEAEKPPQAGTETKT